MMVNLPFMVWVIVISVPIVVAEETAVYNANPSNYLTLFDLLTPGDTHNLSAGTYTEGLSIYDLNGTESQPIIIMRSASGARAVFTRRWGAPFVNGVIEGNLIVDTIGYNMQINIKTAVPACQECPQPIEKRLFGIMYSARPTMRLRGEMRIPICW